MLAKDATFTVIDFETTGVVEGHPNEPWQVGMVVYRDGAPQLEERFESLFRIGDRPFNPFAPGRHHQLRGALARAQTMHALWPKLSGWVTGRPLVAHNAAAERAVLTHMAPLHRFGPWIDTLKLVRLAHPRLASHALEDVADELGLSARLKHLFPERAPHDALFDAAACALLLEYLLQLPGWEDATVAALEQAHPKRFHEIAQARRKDGKATV